jgi:hypothetical protein
MIVFNLGNANETDKIRSSLESCCRLAMTLDRSDASWAFPYRCGDPEFFRNRSWVRSQSVVKWELSVAHLSVISAETKMTKCRYCHN